MVVVQLMGGLGNQMFQYAAGRSLARRRNDDLFLHLARLSSLSATNQSNPNSRTFGLDVFNITAQFTTLDKLQQDRVNIVWTITESGFGFFPEVLEESDRHRNLGLIGWWQSEKYFKEIADTIRKDFTFSGSYKTPYPGSMIDMILSKESVCLHIRRTDYLSEEDTRGTLGINYYVQAVQILMARLRCPHLFVFSDDIEWCKSNLNCPIPMTFVSATDSGTMHAADDFYLMTMCKYFVIANSTYSWWAAWLAKAPGKLVIAPRRWFRAEESLTRNDCYLSSEDLIPESWIRV